MSDANTITSLGVHLANLPLDVRLGKMMLYAVIFRCVDPVITLAATMSVKSPFSAPFDQRNEVDRIKSWFGRDTHSDHLMAWYAHNS